MRRGREAIVKAAIRVFAQKGYAGASVRGSAARLASAGRKMH
jgi:AcrR family transcriptional regulator